VGVVVKLWLYVAAAIMLSGFIGYGIHIVKKANRAEAAEEALDEARKQFAADVSRLSKAAETNRQIASDLAEFRDQQSTASESLRAEIAKRNITREVTREVNGVTTTCRERDPVRYRELFNQAVTGTANP
jgi:hypothetical protein